MSSNRGLTLPEVLISASILGLLSALCLSIYVMGFRAWTKVDAKTELMGILQTSQDRISTEARSSQFPSVSVVPDNSGVAFLSAGDESGRLVDAGGRILWQEFVFFYTLPADTNLYRTTVPYAVSDQTLLTTLEVYSGSPLSSHKVDGEIVARNLVGFEAAMEPPDLLRILLRAKVGEEETELESAYRLTPQP